MNGSGAGGEPKCLALLMLEATSNNREIISANLDCQARHLQSQREASPLAIVYTQYLDCSFKMKCQCNVLDIR